MNPKRQPLGLVTTALCLLLFACTPAATAQPTATAPPPPTSTEPPTSTPVPPPTDTPVPSPTPTKKPTSTPVVPIDPGQIVGIWYETRAAPGNYLLFREDGTWASVNFTGFVIKESDFSESKQYGTFTIEGLDLVLANDPAAWFPCKDAPAGRYQVFMSEDGLIKFETIEDDCSSRNDLFTFVVDNSLLVFEPVD